MRAPKVFRIFDDLWQYCVVSDNKTTETSVKKTIKVNGKEYQVRYVYTRDDGTQWYVLLTDGLNNPGLSGDFNDESPV